MSTVKVNTVTTRSGSTLTLGESGKTVQLATGASQSGFGREGSVNWQTGDIKTSTFTAASGEGYFINSGSAITANLPAGSAGAIVAFSDYARNFATYNFTISANGSEKIGGEPNDLILNVSGQALTLVYVDSTKGWINVQNAEDTEKGASDFIEATGGTVKTSGNFKTHIFTAPGSFVVTNAGNPCGSTKVDYLVVAGAGSGGSYCGSNEGLGGGGAGGFRVSNSVGCVPAPTMSPLVAPNSPSPAGITVPVQTYPITVGGGGAGTCISSSNPGPGNPGNDSIFSSITSAGGGGGGPSPTGNGFNGGSGGGGFRGNSTTGVGGSGNTPSVSPPQGQDGGGGTPIPSQGPPAPAPSRNGGGGGGAGAAGSGGTTSGSGAGGAGSFVADTFIGGCAPSFGSPGPVSSTRYFAGGGGGSGGDSSVGSGGAGGGGAGTRGSPGTNGTDNTGGGGGGANNLGPVPGGGTGGNGGSGIVMIRYKFQ